MSRVKYVKYSRHVKINDSVDEEISLTAELEKGDQPEKVLSDLTSLVDQKLPRLKA